MARGLEVLFLSLEIVDSRGEKSARIVPSDEEGKFVATFEDLPDGRYAVQGDPLFDSAGLSPSDAAVELSPANRSADVKLEWH